MATWLTPNTLLPISRTGDDDRLRVEICNNETCEYARIMKVRFGAGSLYMDLRTDGVNEKVTLRWDGNDLWEVAASHSDEVEIGDLVALDLQN